MRAETLGFRARAARRTVRLVHARVEETPHEFGRFRLITIGDAHWFMRHPGTFDRLEHWLLSGGRVVICAARSLARGEWP
jgi:hypothetical protein